MHKFTLSATRNDLSIIFVSQSHFEFLYLLLILHCIYALHPNIQNHVNISYYILLYFNTSMCWTVTVAVIYYMYTFVSQLKLLLSFTFEMCFILYYLWIFNSIWVSCKDAYQKSRGVHERLTYWSAKIWIANMGITLWL